jgi:hypothetical protein
LCWHTFCDKFCVLPGFNFNDFKDKRKEWTEENHNCKSSIMIIRSSDRAPDINGSLNITNLPFLASEKGFLARARRPTGRDHTLATVPIAEHYSDMFIGKHEDLDAARASKVCMS